MNIAFIGAGNLATHLALSLSQAGHCIVGICSPSGTSAVTLAQRIGQGSVGATDISALPQADVYIIAAKDDAIAEIANHWPSELRGGIVVHTSGSVGVDVLRATGNPYGVFYPLQTFSKDRVVNFREIPCFIEGSTQRVEKVLLALAQSLSERAHVLDSAHRRVLHLSAVFACNFVNHLYDIAEQQLQGCGLPTDWLRPLIEETAEKLKTLSARSAQTGPAIRGDQRVLNAHRQLLADDPRSLNLYNVLSDSIYQTFHS